MAKAHSFPVLDAFRGIAATVVVIDHYPKLFSVATPGLAPVHLFFVISGVVVVHAYEKRLQSGMTSSAFFKLRMIRLYPLYALGTLGVVVLGLSGVMALNPALHEASAFVSTLALAALMLPSLSTDLLYPLNPVAWSLLFEIVINLLYVFTWRRWTVPNLIALSAAGLAALIGCRIYFHYFETGWAWSNAIGGLASVLYCFPVGVLIYRLYNKGWLRIILPWWVLVSLLVAVALIEPPSGRAGDVWRLVHIVAVGPALVALAVTCTPPKWVRPACTLSGNASYGIYTLHIAFFGLVVFAAIEPNVWAGWLALLAFVALSLLVDKFDGQLRERLSRNISAAASPARSEGDLAGQIAPKV